MGRYSVFYVKYPPQAVLASVYPYASAVLESFGGYGPGIYHLSTTTSFRYPLR